MGEGGKRGIEAACYPGGPDRRSHRVRREREIEAAGYLGGPDGRSHRVHRRGEGGRRGSRGKCDCGRMVRGGLLCWQEGGNYRPQAKEGRQPPGSEKATEVGSPLESSAVKCGPSDLQN